MVTEVPPGGEFGPESGLLLQTPVSTEGETRHLLEVVFMEFLSYQHGHSQECCDRHYRFYLINMVTVRKAVTDTIVSVLSTW